MIGVLSAYVDRSKAALGAAKQKTQELEARSTAEIADLEKQIAELRRRIADLRFPAPLAPEETELPTSEEIAQSPASELVEILKQTKALSGSRLLSLIKEECVRRIVANLGISSDIKDRLAESGKREAVSIRLFGDGRIYLQLAFNYDDIGTDAILSEISSILSGLPVSDLRIAGRPISSNVNVLSFYAHDAEFLSDLIAPTGQEHPSSNTLVAFRTVGNYLSGINN